MKGNEARVVFFLHPVDQLKDGQVSQVKPLTSSIGIRFLLLLGLLLALGVLLFVFLQFGVQARSQQEPVSMTEVPFTTTTERTGETDSFDTTEQSKGNESTTELERSTTWLLYPLVASSSLLLAYLAALIMQWAYSRSELVQGWMRRLRGKLPKEEKMLLHTLPYYLAITRSSCEVSWKKISFSDSKLS